MSGELERLDAVMLGNEPVGRRVTPLRPASSVVRPPLKSSRMAALLIKELRLVTDFQAV